MDGAQRQQSTANTIKSPLRQTGTWSLLFGVGALLGGAVTAMMSQGKVWAEQPGACRQEIQQLCATAEQGPARQACVKQNFEKLSPPCQEKIRARWEKHSQKAAPEAGPAQK
jgi:hypothetical protein